MAAHPKIMGCGEAHHLIQDFQINEKCPCGQKAQTCSFWAAVYQRFQQNPSDLNTIDFFSLLTAPAAPKTTYFVDASKTTWKTMLRPFSLSKKHDLYCVHLIRDGLSCLDAKLKRMPEDSTSSQRFKETISVASHWLLANFMAKVWRWKNSKQYIFVRYESLIQAPEKTLLDLFHRLDLDASGVIDLIKNQQAIPLSHQLSGNAIRNRPNLVLQQEIAPLQHSKLGERRLFQSITWFWSKVFNF